MTRNRAQGVTPRTLPGRRPHQTAAVRIRAVIVALVSLGTACLTWHAAAAAVVGVDPPPGYHVEHVKRAGVSMAVPDDWLVFEQTREDVEAILEANPDLGDVDELLDNARRTPLRAAYNVSADGVAEASLTVEFERGVERLGSPAAARAELEMAGIDEIEVERTKVAGRRALRLEAGMTLSPPAGGDPVRLRFALYSLVTGKGRLNIGFTERETEDHSETFDTMIDSVQVFR